MQHTVFHRFSPRQGFQFRLVKRIAAAWMAVWLSVGIALVSPVSISSAAPTDAQIKAVFLLNFTRFIEWPPTAFADPTSDLIIGVLGDDPFGAELDNAINGETRDRHAIVVARYQTIDDIGACHILFISRSERSKVSTILKKLTGHSVLTVADDAGLARNGVMISLITTDNRIKLDINLKAASAAGLTLSSKLLRAATVVDAGAEP